MRIPSTKLLRLTAIVATTTTLLTACQTTSVKEAEVDSQLSPVPKLSRDVGYRQDGVRDGKPYFQEVVAATSSGSQYRDSDGCSWVSDAPFQPAQEWSGCPDSAGGTQTSTLTGTPYPIEVGRRWSYAYEGRNEAGATWSGTRKCEVLGTARISTSDGEHDTFKVECVQPGGTRTWFISAAVQEVVAFERASKSRGTAKTEFTTAK